MRLGGFLGDSSMRAAVVAVTACVVVAGAALAADRLKPEEIKATFFTGQPFTASTPANVKYTMVFTPDGNVTRTPVGKSGNKGEGTWKLSREGYCTAWKGSKAACFTVLPAGENKWSIMQGTAIRASWSK
jgi:hypothetical protein